MPRSEIESMLHEVCVEARGSAQDPCVISAEQMLNLLAGRNVVQVENQCKTSVIKDLYTYWMIKLDSSQNSTKICNT